MVQAKPAQLKLNKKVPTVPAQFLPTNSPRYIQPIKTMKHDIRHKELSTNQTSEVQANLHTLDHASPIPTTSQQSPKWVSFRPNLAGTFPM